MIKKMIIEAPRDFPQDIPLFLGLRKINIILGKNGCGKSTLLRKADLQFQDSPFLGRAKYVTPERGGSLSYDGNVETNMNSTPMWLTQVRRANRNDNFRQISVGEFRRLETLVLREIEKDYMVRGSDFTFDAVVKDINGLLDNVEITRAAEAGFQVRNSGSSDIRNDLTNLSSGESELISLAIEVLSFAYQIKRLPAEDGKEYLLLLDEPDVHLHPDLQNRFMNLLYRTVCDTKICVIIATHSTSILSSLTKYGDSQVTVAFMNRNDSRATFRPITEIIQDVLPIFGAHPLSNVFLERSILLVEGEDDERIWQQATRSSKGQISLWPCAAGDIQSLDEYENAVEEISGAIYDHPIAYSLRDRDDSPYMIDDKLVVKRMRLQCRAAENLLLSDDVLFDLGTTWPEMQSAIELWISNNLHHKQALAMQKFRDGGYDRMSADLKTLRNLIMERAGSQKPWEVAIGQSIARLCGGKGNDGPNGLRAFLGLKLVSAFIP